MNKEKSFSNDDILRLRLLFRNITEINKMTREVERTSMRMIATFHNLFKEFLTEDAPKEKPERTIIDFPSVTEVSGDAGRK